MRKSKLALILLLFSICAVLLLSVTVKESGGVAFDAAVASFTTTIFPEQTRAFFRVIQLFGEELGIAVVGIATILWLWIRAKNYQGMALLLIAVGVGNEVNSFIKDFIKRPRPDLKHFADAEGFSFPSGHAMVGMILYFVVAYFIFKELKSMQTKWLIGSLFGLLLVLIGASRIVLQVHYPSDVLAGFAMGYLWVYLMITGYEWLIDRKKVIQTTDYSKNI
ncbi:phosphatase PAP2 family protein [Bacillus sp. T3]|uniref:phosphatase PAP2 family protein n=1 Tax=Bacillus sp. T3 TaxID=467262 RepID=UPI0029828BA3|nr:phosphatase PAP2 family protein [Bacillus sp. T3]